MQVYLLHGETVEVAMDAETLYVAWKMAKEGHADVHVYLAGSRDSWNVLLLDAALTFENVILANFQTLSPPKP